MLIKDALSSLSSKPALFIAPLLVVLALTFYYRDLYSKCSDIKHYRVMLNQVLDSTGAPGRFHLAEFTDFEWDKVRIATLEQDGKTVECPLDWNWSSGERESLLASGSLSAMVFGLKGRIVKYFELRSDEVGFDGELTKLTPETAIFDIKSGDSGNRGFILSPTDPNN